MQVILDSSFARPGSAPIWGGKKGEFRDWTIPIKRALKILSRLLEVNFQINYSTVLLGFDLLQMANDCDEYISTKNRLSDILSNEPPLKFPSSGGGGIHSRSFFFLLVSFFINLVISLFAYLFILIFIHFFSLLY